MHIKKKRIVIIIIVLLLIGTLSLLFIRYNRTQKIVQQDSGNFCSTIQDYENIDGAFRIALYDEIDQREYYQTEWNVDFSNMKYDEKFFVYKKGLAVNGTDITVGTWKRDKEGDYTLYIDGSYFGSIIKNVDNSIIKNSLKYMFIFSNGEKYSIEKESGGITLYSKLP